MLNKNSQFWKEIRCTGCRKLLGLEYIFSGRLWIKCPHCNVENIIIYKTPHKLIAKVIEQDAKDYNPDKEPVIDRNDKK